MNSVALSLFLTVLHLLLVWTDSTRPSTPWQPPTPLEFASADQSASWGAAKSHQSAPQDFDMKLLKKSRLSSQRARFFRNQSSFLPSDSTLLQMAELSPMPANKVTPCAKS